MMYQPDLEMMPLPQLRKLQSGRLRHMISRLYEKVPFYRSKMEEVSIRPEDILGIEDLHQLPFTNKSDLRDHYPFGLFTIPQNELRRIHASSGTTGKPTVVGYSAADLEVFDEVVARSLVCAGARPGMKLHNAYGYGLFTGGLGMHGGAQKLGMAVIPVSGGMTDRQLMILEDFQPDVICCTPSYAQTLAEEIASRGISLQGLNLKYAVLGAEPWTETIRTQVERGLGVTATNIYGLSEIIGPGVSQEAYEERGTGSHIWEDHFFPEVVDKDTGEPLPYGQEGVLVFTTLTKEAMPLLRYRTNDICSIYYDEQSQRSHIKMSPIKGRADDMLIIRGVNLFHTQVEVLLQEFSEVVPNYQLLVSRTKSLDEVALKVELAPEFEQGLSSLSSISKAEKLQALSSRLQAKIRNNIGLSMSVQLMAYQSIPRSQGGKLNRVVDER